MEYSRKIEFRQWHYPTDEYIYSDIYDGARRAWCSSVSDPEMFTGFYDAFGSALYEGDYIEVYSWEAQQKVPIGCYLITWDQTHGVWCYSIPGHTLHLHHACSSYGQLSCKRRSSVHEDKNHSNNIA